LACSFFLTLFFLARPISVSVLVFDGLQGMIVLAWHAFFSLHFGIASRPPLVLCFSLPTPFFTDPEDEVRFSPSLFVFFSVFV